MSPGDWGNLPQCEHGVEPDDWCLKCNPPKGGDAHDDLRKLRTDLSRKRTARMSRPNVTTEGATVPPEETRRPDAETGDGTPTAPSDIIGECDSCGLTATIAKQFPGDIVICAECSEFGMRYCGLKRLDLLP